MSIRLSDEEIQEIEDAAPFDVGFPNTMLFMGQQFKTSLDVSHIPGQNPVWNTRWLTPFVLGFGHVLDKDGGSYRCSKEAEGHHAKGKGWTLGKLVDIKGMKGDAIVGIQEMTAQGQ